MGRCISQASFHSPSILSVMLLLPTLIPITGWIGLAVIEFESSISATKTRFHSVVDCRKNATHPTLYYH